MVYTWARAFKAIGVKESEVIPYYGPFFPDICAMTFALNMIGACPYFLKLAISPQALSEETKESRIAIVFDDMWENVSCEFAKERFEKVIIVKATDGMASPKKQIVSLLSKLKSKSGKIPTGGKYYSIKKAIALANTYTGEVKAPFVPNRSAFITSSSGTTFDGVVKGTVATNESTISQLYMSEVSNVQCYPHDRCLNNLPPTASTSLNVMFFMPLFFGETIIIDPRLSENAFYKQLTDLKPSIALTTGSCWEAFFNRVQKELDAGSKFDFSHTYWIVGGEGTDCRKYKKWNQIIKNSGGTGIYSGYGSSELFSATSVEKLEARYDFSKKIMSVGIPYAGINMGIFDESGKELGYNQRGELWIKSKSAMKEYYNKPELTALTMIDGWIRTGDLGEIDENGFVYIWGRVKDVVSDNKGNKIYLFDIANKIKETSFIDDAIVLPMRTDNSACSLVAHIVWEEQLSREEQKKNLEELNDRLKDYLPQPLAVVAYAVHDVMLPYSPTTLKKDKNKLSKQTSGYIQVIDGQIRSVEFTPVEDGKYKMSVKD